MKMIYSLLASLFALSVMANNNPFPEIDGWTKSSEIQTYEADNLWDYINGAAESYHAYDFEVLHVCDYKQSEEVYVTVEIYKHATPENAFGIYSAERPRVSDFLKTGAEGYYEPGILNFIKGGNYIKMRSAGESLNKKDMVSIATAVAASLNGSGELPKELQLFPEQGKIPHTTLFVGENFIGYSSLHDAYIADYKVEDDEFRVFVIARKTEDALDELLEDYLSKRTEMEKLPLNEMVQISDPYNGTIYMLKKGNYAKGTINLEDRKTAENVLK